MKRIIATSILLMAGFTAAFAQSDAAKQFAPNPAELIDGTCPGVSVSTLDGNINGAASVIIRGVNTMRADSQPLWVVDGVILNNSLNQNLDGFPGHDGRSFTAPLNMMAFLNPADIESIEILKDLSATAIYGSLGANGVIVIKTKKASKDGMSLDWTSNAGVSFPSESGEIFRPAVSHNHSLRLNGTSGNSTYVIGANFRSYGGTVKGTGNNFGGLTIGMESTGNKLVSFGMNSSLAIGDMNSAAGASYFTEGSTTVAQRASDGSAAAWLTDYDDDVVDFRTVNSIWINVNLAKSLKWRTELGVDFEDNGRGIWYDNGTGFGAEVNRAASQIQASMFRYNLASTLAYSHFFNVDHCLDISAGVGTISTANTFNTLSGTDYFTGELRAKGISIAASRRPINRYEHTHAQYFASASASYAYKSAAGLDANLRLDTTPRYDSWSPTAFYGVRGWAEMTELLGIDGGILSSLRAEAGYGKAGYEQYIPYRLLGNYTTGGYPAAEEGTEEYYEGLNLIRSGELSGGIKAGFADNRFTVNVEAYRKVTDDILNTYCFGALEGKLWTRTQRQDLTTLKSVIGNAGVELTLSADIIRRQGLNWNVTAMGDFNHNAVLELADNDIYGKKVGSGIYCNMNSVGYPVGSLIGVKVDENGGYVDYTEDGRISEEDKRLIGNPFPKFHGALSSSLDYGKFSAEMLFTCAAGYDIMNLNGFIGAEEPYIISEKNLEQASYLRLKRLSAAYKLPEFVRGMKDIKVTLSAYNLFTFSRYNGWNPAVSCFGMSTLAAGIDYGSFPVNRSIMIGISAIF